MINLNQFEVWFLTGSQHLYGEETLNQVAEHAQQIARCIGERLPARVVYRPVLKTTEEIYATLQEANNEKNCIGIITWMHTFSPAKMWIRGLSILQKPMLHLHTQYNRDIPWSSIDMDFMNLNQSAHGDREFGFIVSRMRRNRKVVVGHWQDPEVISQIETWTRAAAAWQDWQGAKFVRFGDNMRNVAVTEGDKVEAEMQFGFSVNTFGVGDLAASINEVTDDEIKTLLTTYRKKYHWNTSPHFRGGDISNPEQNPVAAEEFRDVSSALYQAAVEAARIEIGLRNFLEAVGAKGFTDTFEDLHGINQLPGLPVQRLLAEGYGFAAEGDWKTAALVRACKVMGAGLPGGNAFMEDYTYHFDQDNELVLGAHMLEVDESIAMGKAQLEVHPLAIGGKASPARLVFNVSSGSALNSSLVDMGNRFRLLINEVEAVAPKHDMPNLPVARVLWKPLPDLKTACAAWIQAGGAHHTCYSQNLGAEHLQAFAEMAGIEYVLIGRDTKLNELCKELRWNEYCYR